MFGARVLFQKSFARKQELWQWGMVHVFETLHLLQVRMRSSIVDVLMLEHACRHPDIHAYMCVCVHATMQRCVCVCVVYKLAMIRQITILTYVCVYDVYMQAHQDTFPSVCLYAS